MNKILLYIFGILLITTVSCIKEPEVWDSSTVDFAGDWWAEHSDATHNYGMKGIMSYNTASDNGSEIWLTDNKHFWDYKVKCPVNKADLTFGGVDLVNAVPNYAIKITIKDGKILKNAARSKSGVQVDSIYYKISFSDASAPDTFYEVKGLRKTGFAEDNY